MAKKYSDCFFCGGAVEEQLTLREIRWKSKLFVFENVPLGVCTQCGEKVITPEVAKVIDQLLHERKKPSKTIEVPVYQYEPKVA